MNDRVFQRLSFVPPILVAGLLFSAVPSFAQIYAGFGTPLQAQTTFLLGWYRILAFVPFLFLVGWYAWAKSESRGIATLCLSGFLSGAVFVFSVWAAYSPLFALGSQP